MRTVFVSVWKSVSVDDAWKIFMKLPCDVIIKYWCGAQAVLVGPTLAEMIRSTDQSES